MLLLWGDIHRITSFLKNRISAATAENISLLNMFVLVVKGL
jgi:hypothetical protein